jgi:hypothetical protein
MSRLLSGSALGIAVECGWAYHKDSSYPEPQQTDAASDGTDVHAVLAGESVSVRPELMATVGQTREWLAKRGITILAREITYACKVTDRSIRVLGDHLNRKYLEAGLDPEYEIPITLDVVGRDQDGAFVVLDYKTGQRDYVAPAESNLQLGLGALCVASAYQTRKVRVMNLFVAPTGCYADEATLGAVHLMQVQQAVDKAWLNTKKRLPTVPGEQCRFCPGLGACPSTQENLGQLAPVIGTELYGVTFTSQHVSTENDAKLAILIPMMEKALEKIKDALKTRAPIQLPNGKVWKAVVSSRSNLNKSKVEELLGPRIAECYTTVEVESYRQVNNKG